LTFFTLPTLAGHPNLGIEHLKLTKKISKIRTLRRIELQQQAHSLSLLVPIYRDISEFIGTAGSFTEQKVDGGLI
jgi:hypothetical protein